MYAMPGGVSGNFFPGISSFVPTFFWPYNFRPENFWIFQISRQHFFFFSTFNPNFFGFFNFRAKKFPAFQLSTKKNPAAGISSHACRVRSVVRIGLPTHGLQRWMEGAGAFFVCAAIGRNFFWRTNVLIGKKGWVMGVSGTFSANFSRSQRSISFARSQS